MGCSYQKRSGHGPTQMFDSTSRGLPFLAREITSLVSEGLARTTPAPPGIGIEKPVHSLKYPDRVSRFFSLQSRSRRLDKQKNIFRIYREHPLNLITIKETPLSKLNQMSIRRLSLVNQNSPITFQVFQYFHGVSCSFLWEHKRTGVHRLWAKSSHKSHLNGSTLDPYNKREENMGEDEIKLVFGGRRERGSHF